MIEKCGYAEIAEVYSSTDLRCTKYEKTIFNAVAEKEGVQGKEILHIGDNLKADVENARQSGWNAVWYDRNFHLDKSREFSVVQDPSPEKKVHFGIGSEEILPENCILIYIDGFRVCRRKMNVSKSACWQGMVIIFGSFFRTWAEKM